MRTTQFFLLLLLRTAPLFAADFKEELPLAGLPVEQYFVTVSGSDSKLYRATIEKTETRCIVSATLPELPPATLIGAVMVLADGSVISGPLHRADSDELTKEPEMVALARVNQLKGQLESIEQRNDQLEQTLKSQTSELRKRAGLAEVDLAYERIDKLEAEIAEFGKNKIDGQ